VAREAKLRLENLDTGNAAAATAEGAGAGQGLILVHNFAQPEPYLSLKPAKHPTTWDNMCSP